MNRTHVRIVQCLQQRKLILDKWFKYVNNEFLTPGEVTLFLFFIVKSTSDYKPFHNFKNFCFYLYDNQSKTVGVSLMDPSDCSESWKFGQERVNSLLGT